jgi:hypothetical protein
MGPNRTSEEHAEHDLPENLALMLDIRGAPWLA